MSALAQPRLSAFVDKIWRDEIMPTLVDYIRIPNKSPLFEPNWAKARAHGQGRRLFAGWARSKLAALPGATLSSRALARAHAAHLIDIPGKNDDVVLLYGHLDKQPEMTGWAEGKGPWIPVIEGDKLYGRGGADDGYAIFARDERDPGAEGAGA